MNDRAHVSSIGLKKNETAVLHSILRIVENLTHDFSVLSPSEFGAADLLFVDAHNNSAIKEAGKLREHNNDITEIFVGDSEDEIPDALVLRRPIVIKRVREVLKTALRLRSQKPHKLTNETSYEVAISRVLVVDDSAPVRTYMSEKLPQLSAGRLDIDFAEDGDKALHILKERIYDLVFLDVVMPGADGYEICKWLKSIHPKTRVVMLTGKKSPFDKVRGSMSGCDAYLVKPPKDAKLMSILRKPVKHRR